MARLAEPVGLVSGPADKLDIKRHYHGFKQPLLNGVYLIRKKCISGKAVYFKN